MKLNSIRCFVSEKERLETFRRWPLTHSATPYEFVQAGFYYSGERDKVICAFCNGELLNWKPTDKPMEEHRRTFPDCIFVKDSMRPIQNGASPIVNKSAYYRQPVISTAKSHDSTMVQSAPVYNTPSLNRLTETQQRAVETNSKHIYLHPMDKPCCTPQATRHNVYTDYTKEHNRLNSFTNWSSRKQAPQELARAGFYYTGSGDRVQCFACKGIVKFWQADDDPWIEHAKFFPKCPYLKLCMGEGLTSAIHKEATHIYPRECIDSNYDGVDICR